MRHFYQSLTILAILLLGGCGGPKGLKKLYPIEIGNKEIQTHIAITPAEHAKGLMHRKQLPADQGMLFVFSEAEKQSFWMKNTLIPLDIGFFSPDLVLREVHSMQPQNRNPITSNSHNIMYALEMNQGFFRKNNLPPGSRINQARLAEVLNERTAR